MKKYIIFLAGLGIGIILGYAVGEKAVPPVETSIYQTEIKAVVTEETEPIEQNTENEFVSLGMFTATAYCPCNSCSGGWGNSTSTGAIATAGRTIAVDPTVIAYGTHVWINEHEYIAEDTGGAIKGNKVDIYFNTHAEALQWGNQTVELFVKG